MIGVSLFYRGSEAGLGGSLTTAPGSGWAGDLAADAAGDDPAADGEVAGEEDVVDELHGRFFGLWVESGRDLVAGRKLVDALEEGAGFARAVEDLGEVGPVDIEEWGRGAIAPA